MIRTACLSSSYSPASVVEMMKPWGPFPIPSASTRDSRVGQAVVFETSTFDWAVYREGFQFNTSTVLTGPFLLVGGR